jgi:ubiquinone/menaquinone biosynthesis C-methylase UbiE
MLVEAQKKKFAQEVNFIKADMFTADFGQNCFDLVALGFWFSHQPRQAYAQLYNVLVRPLKPDGLIWMIDNNPPAEGSAHPSVGLDDSGNHLQTRKLSDDTEHQILKNYFTADELKQLFEPRFEIKSLIHNRYYSSAVLSSK